MNTERILLVSFGDSKEYIYKFSDSHEPYSMEHAHPLEKIEDEIKSYLEEKFPDQSVAYYYSARVTEIQPEHAAQYSSYPELNAEAIEEIERVLTKEIEARAAIEELNSNAPFNDVPA